MQLANDITSELQTNGVDPNGLTGTVQGAVNDLFSRGSVTAAAIANKILERHPEYCSGRANGMSLREVGETASVATWIGRVRNYFDRTRAPLLHGRLVLIGLSYLDGNVRSQLSEHELMPALVNELQELVETLLHRPPTSEGTSDASSGTETKAEAQGAEVEARGEGNVSQPEGERTPSPATGAPAETPNLSDRPDDAHGTTTPPATDSLPATDASTGTSSASTEMTSATTPAQQSEGAAPQETSDQPDAAQDEHAQAAPAQVTPAQVTLGDLVEEYGADKLHTDTVYVFQYAARLSRTLRRPVDSVILLASILYLAEGNRKDTGLFLCKLLREGMSKPPRTTRDLAEAAARLFLAPELKTKRFPERPDTNSREWKKTAIEERDLRRLFDDFFNFALRSNAAGQVHPRHIIAACLLSDTFTLITYPIHQLLKNIINARLRLVEFIAEQHKKSEKAEEWRSFFGIKEDAVAQTTEQADTKTEPAAELETEVASVLHASVSDQPVHEDTLGFEPYVTAMAEFLANPQTVPPLTLSIEGEWGSGKPSFMLQLKDKLCNITVVKRAKLIWSSGKSVRRRRKKIPRLLRRFGPLRRLTIPGPLRKKVLKVTCPTVQFNAWRHDKEDALWASFAIEFLRQLKRQLSRRARLRAHLWLLVRRFKWADGLPTLLRVSFLALLYVFFTVLLVYVLSSGGLESLLVRKPAEKAEQAAPANPQAGAAEPLAATQPNAALTPPAASAPTPPAVASATPVTGPVISPTPEEEFKPEVAFLRLARRAGVIGYLALTIFFAIKLKDFLGNPLAANLRQYVDAPDYNSRVAFIEHFHEDFKKIVETYAGRSKVYVFIDDLDRCDVPKAADLMQALNLMIADSPQIIFIIGMDREKVAAGLVVKYAALLPYILPAHAPTAAAKKKAAANGSKKEKAEGAEQQPFNPAGGLEYGYSFIEKFIQLPFRIPQPGDDNVRSFLETISKAFAEAGTGESKQVGQGEEPSTTRPALDESEKSTGAQPDKSKDEPKTVAGRTPDAATPLATPVLQQTPLTPEQKEQRRKVKLEAFNDSPEISET